MSALPKACPKCEMAWAYVVDGFEGSHLIGIVVNDRVAEWLCPACEARWARGGFAEIAHPVPDHDEPQPVVATELAIVETDPDAGGGR